MKTIIFCTSYIDENNYKRYKNWTDYYFDKLGLFNSSGLFLIDDGSPNIFFDKRIDIHNSYELPGSLKKNINLFHFENRLGRSSIADYPGWWRSFSFSIKLVEKYDIDKIIHIESDFYILSGRMIDYIEKLSSGWTAFYSKYYDFPETAIQVICNDTFDKLYEIYERAVEQNYKFDKLAEFIFPYTNVEKNFHGDRFGELNVLQGWLSKIETPFNIDYIGQMNEKHTLKDFERFFQFDYL
ncbi:MAG: hypothetical protein KDD02_18280 [Phaeodactylibacter sp.]|nr:hypothetical protein [Phaeodactylibacter sp.]MCB9299234.1 hypothetical protein [Lewinellaceae bacterium]